MNDENYVSDGNCVNDGNDVLRKHGKIILEIAKMILEIGVDGTKEDFDRLLGYIAEAESHARCSWVDCEADADDLAEYYDLVLRVNRGDTF